mgnify:CR=1 FL=1
MIPFRLSKKGKFLAVSAFILLISISYVCNGYIWGTTYTIIAWFIPVLLNLNNWLFKRTHEK